MKFLLDTNIFIPLEPSASGEVHPRSEIAARLLRLLVEGGHQYYVHPELKTDLSRDRDLERQRQREVVRAKVSGVGPTATLQELGSLLL